MKVTQMNTEMTVAVWSYNEKRFIHHIDCKNEKRVRVDVHDDLEDYAVFEVEMTGTNSFNVVNRRNPLKDWVISYS